jgi:hypothetical protein
VNSIMVYLTTLSVAQTKQSEKTKKTVNCEGFRRKWSWLNLKHYSSICTKESRFLLDLRVVGDFFALPTNLVLLKHCHNQRLVFCGVWCDVHSWCSQTEHPGLYWNSEQMFAKKCKYSCHQSNSSIKLLLPRLG